MAALLIDHTIPMSRSGLFLAGVLFLGLVPTSVMAVALGRLGEISGSYRNLLFAATTRAGDFVQTDLNRLRLEWSWTAAALAAYAAYDQEIFAGGGVASAEFKAAARRPEATYADAEAAILRRPRILWRHRLYRAWVSYDIPSLLLKIGRQRIAWGTGRLWNPSDRFNPVDPTALEPDEKTGVDSLYAEVRFSGTGALQAVAAPGRASHRTSRKLALRVRDTLGEMDVSFLGGRIGVEKVFGGDFAANLWKGNLHAEILSAREHGAPYTQATAGYEYTLKNRIFPAGLYLLGEYFFNGAAARVDVRPSVDRLFSRERHQLGLAAGYDLSPLWRLDATLIADVVKGSVFISPRLGWSARENVQVTAFALLFGGHGGGEFSGRANVYALQLEAFF